MLGAVPLSAGIGVARRTRKYITQLRSPTKSGLRGRRNQSGNRGEFKGEEKTRQSARDANVSGRPVPKRKRTYDSGRTPHR